MGSVQPASSGTSLRDATVLALARLDGSVLAAPGRWSGHEAATIRTEAARLLSRQADAATLLGPAVSRLVHGIPLVPFLEPGGPFGPAWPAHPFASPAMAASYRLREPDVTRALANLMGPSAGRQGTRRALTFLRLLTELAGAESVRATLTDAVRPTVIDEHRVQAPRSRAMSAEAAVPKAATRIDLLFEWPLGADGRRAVVVIEAKLGAVVSEGQLRPYRAEALRRARGGPVALVLLTGWADAAERRYRSWSPVRWFALLRRWEGLLAEAGDADPEFARLRAHLWRFILSNRRALP